MPEIDKKRRVKLQRKVDKRNGYRSYCDKDVEVRNGGPCGHGMYAVRQFLPGELVVEIGGQLHSQKEYDCSRYVMELDKKWYLEPDIPGAFANHSCNPNSELIQLTKHTMGLVAICNIEPGTEICYDYQWPAVDWIPQCHCGAPNCRGWVVAAEEAEKMQRIARRAKSKKRKPR